MKFWEQVDYKPGMSC